MPHPSAIDPKHKAKVKRWLKDNKPRRIGLSNADPPGESWQNEPEHSALWLKSIEPQEFTKVDRHGNHIPPRGGSIPTVGGRRGLSRKR